MRPQSLKTFVLLLLAAMFAIHLVMAWNSRDLIRKGYPDFTIFYSAGKILREGLGSKLYDESTQYRIQQEFAAGVSIRQGPLPYNHPPFEALLFLPFIYLPYFSAYLLWNAINLLILCSLPFLLRPHIPILRQVPVALVVFTSLAFFPVFIAFLQGQDILLLVLLFVLAYVCLNKRADFAAGCWLGLGLFRFHLVLPLVLILFLLKRRQVIFGFLCVALALIVVSILVMGWNAALNYPAYVWHVEQTMEKRKTAVPIGMPNLRGLIDALSERVLSKTARGSLVAMVSIALIIFAALRCRGRNFDLGFSLAVITTILVGYHAFVYDLSLLLLPIALLANYSLQQAGLDRRSFALLAPIAVLFLTPLHMLLALNSDRYSLMALPLIVSAWLIARELSRRAGTTPKSRAMQSS
jgi:Glycosyltransferase family 87